MKDCKHKNKNPIAHTRGAENTTLYECSDCGESFWVTLNDEIAQASWENTLEQSCNPEERE